MLEPSGENLPANLPGDFMFQLSSEGFHELLRLKPQTAISKKGRGGRRIAPYAFTAHGVADEEDFSKHLLGLTPSPVDFTFPCHIATLTTTPPIHWSTVEALPDERREAEVGCFGVRWL
jgi:hypothetical protein